MDNPKVIVKETGKYGKGLFAKENIKKGEIIASFDGDIYEAEKASDLPSESPNVRDYAIQFEEHKWRYSNGFAIIINHSCEPNCGIKNNFDIVAIRDIQKGEELTLDYDMTENSDWTMKCSCGSKNCRKIIKGYRHLPEELKKKYKNYISEYLK